jgi:uncharacterized membrane protein YfcA
MTLPGALAMVAVGLTLGLIGGGGSILTVPILVYILGIAATEAMGFSLFIVGATSCAGAVAHAARGNVSLRIAATFAGPSLVAAYLVRRWLVPAIPRTIALGGWSARRDDVLMMGFALVMAAAATAMIRTRRSELEPFDPPRPAMLAPLGGFVGAVAGLFGAGGGFLIVPALVLVADLPMALAIGTSLAIITTQSLAGFVGVVQTAARIDWPLLLALTALALSGMAGGLALGRRVSGASLRAGFGWFVLAMSGLIAAAELVSLSIVR